MRLNSVGKKKRIFDLSVLRCSGYEAKGCNGQLFPVERTLNRTAGGHLLLDIADASTGRKIFKEADSIATDASPKEAALDKP